MAGTINLSLSQQLDEYGQPLSGGSLYIIQAGTVSTPQNAYQDTGLSILMPYPIPLDAAGRIPQFFLADATSTPPTSGLVKVRLQDKNGVVKFTQDGLLVIGPSAGGGGGGAPVDPSTVLSTGDLKIRYGINPINGFVRLNGKTISNTGAGGTELNDASAQALFLHLWNNDLTLPVYSGGVAVARGANASADWTNGRAIQLPDGRARLLMALADMGSVDVGKLAGVTFDKGNPTTLGSMFGNARKTLGVSELPNHQHQMQLHDPGHHHSYTQMTMPAGSGVGAGPLENPTAITSTTSTDPTGITIGQNAPNFNDGNTSLVGGGLAFDLANPAILVTVYIKL
jgi:hypothetical protein